MFYVKGESAPDLARPHNPRERTTPCRRPGAVVSSLRRGASGVGHARGRPGALAHSGELVRPYSGAATATCQSVSIPTGTTARKAPWSVTSGSDLVFAPTTQRWVFDAMTRRSPVTTMAS